MKITKYEHALLLVEEDGAQLIVDPGSYSSLPPLNNVTAVSLSHVHDDHSFRPHIERIAHEFPQAKIFGTREVAEKFKDLPVQVVYHGDRHEVGPFVLDFFGDLHQLIHRSLPVVQNFGLMVNSKLYYPGDSYTIPDLRVEILACPSSAPWLRISDVIDFLNEVKPQKCFPSHNALLSENGHSLQNARIKEIVESHSGEFRYLQIGDSWVI
jgi:L-ascorbate metabolism protein UlaG (beta-lactamase superfamily)